MFSINNRIILLEIFIIHFFGNLIFKLVKIFEWQFYPLATPYLARDTYAT